MVAERDRALEDDALAIVPGQRDRLIRLEYRTLGRRPLRLGIGKLDGAAVGNPPCSAK